MKQTSCPGVWKYSEVALASAVDLCRGATVTAVEEDEEVPLRLLAIDVAHEIKVYILSSKFVLLADIHFLPECA